MFLRNEMGVRGIASAANLLSMGRYSFWPSQSMRFDEGGDDVPPVEPKKGVEDPSAANLEKPGVNPSEGVPPGGTPAAGENQDDKIAGLTAAAVAEREKRQDAEAETQNLKDQMALTNAQAQPEQQAKQAGLYQAVAKQLGIDTELATPDEQGQIFDGMMQVTSGQQSEQSFVNSHSDYSEVVGVPGPGGQFQYAAPLLRVLKANPVLANALNNSPNKAVLAYEIASKDPQYLKDRTEAAKSDDTKAAEKAATKITAANQQLSIGAAKGGGNLDDAARRAAQTDEEFRKENEQIMTKATQRVERKHNE